MKHIIFLLLCMSCPYIYGAEKVEKEKATDEARVDSRMLKRASRDLMYQGSWFFTFNTGGQIYFGDHDKQLDVFNRISPRFEIGAGRWLNEFLGLRLSVGGYKLKGLTQDPNLSTGEVYDASRYLDYQKYSFISTNFDLLFDWRRRINNSSSLSYKQNYKYSIIPYVGIGAMFGLDKGYPTVFSPSVGLLQTYQLNQDLDLNLDMRANICSDSFDGEKGGRTAEGMFTMQVGLTYNVW